MDDLRWLDQHTLTLSWARRQPSPSTDWTLAVTDEAGATVGGGTVDFGTGGMAAETISAIDGTTGTSGAAATVKPNPKLA